MGKKVRAAPPSAEALSKVSTLTQQGSALFSTGDYAGARRAWEEALSLAPPRSDAAALLLSNRAACHMMARSYNAAAQDCTAALRIRPSFFQALVRRAKALEQLGQLSLALRDARAANALDMRSSHSEALERRLAEALAARAAPGSAENGPAPSAVEGGETSAQRAVVPAQLVFGEEVRRVYLPVGLTYYELLEASRSQFSGLDRPFQLRSVDEAGRAVTLACAADLRRVLDAASLRRRAGGDGTARIELVPVDAEAQVPAPPAAEVARVQEMLRAAARAEAGAGEAEVGAERGSAGARSGSDAQSQPVVVDEWLLGLAGLLRERCQLDVDRALEAGESGMERLSEAFQAMMASDAKAQNLLSQALERFDEQVCVGLYNGAMVHQNRADFAMHAAAREGKSGNSVEDEVEAALSSAERRLEAALAHKASFVDAYQGLSQVAQTRAKLAADYLVEPVAEETKEEGEKKKEDAGAAPETAGLAATRRAMARVTPASLAAAEPRMEEAYALMRRALEALPEEEAARELHPLPAGAGDQAGEAGVTDEVPPRAGILIHQGNTHYEHSILRAAGGGDWREHLDRAVALFEESGAHPEDVCHAVQGHPLAEQVPDLLKRLEQRCQQRRADKERAGSNGAGQANGAETAPQGGVKPLPPQTKVKA